VPIDRGVSGQLKMMCERQSTTVRSPAWSRTSPSGTGKVCVWVSDSSTKRVVSGFLGGRWSIASGCIVPIEVSVDILLDISNGRKRRE
jgi:hypothetical protein